MNLFRSEEHVRNWSSYDPTAAEGTLPVGEWVALFHAESFRAKLQPGYFLRRPELRETIAQTLAGRGKVGRFWGVPAP